MIKNLLTITFILAGLAINAQSFTATYSFALTTSVSGTTDPSIPPTFTGVSFGAFSAVGTGTSSTASGRFSFTNWPTGATTAVDNYSSMTGALDPAKYYEVAVVPAIGYEMTLTNITFGARRSGTGIRSYAVRSDLDAYATNLPASVVTNTNISVVGTNEFFWNLDATSTSSDQNGSLISLSGPNFTSMTTGVTFRFYAWNSEAGTGTFSIDNVTFVGSASVITGLGKLKFDLNADLNIYPMPSHDGVVFIESKSALEVSKIEVLDVLGNIVLSNATKNETKIKVNLADMPNGNYFVRVYSGNSVSTKKIAVIK
jgi:hypothetical protein